MVGTLSVTVGSICQKDTVRVRKIVPVVRSFCRRRFITTSSVKRGAENGTGTGTESPDGQDYLTNAGIVEGVWIFCRHGDRAPSRPLSPAHVLEEEGDFWASRLPLPSTMEAYQTFSKYFPPIIHPSNDGQFLDVLRAPFGFLTDAGIKQTRENGSRLFNRYNRHGHHLPEHEQYLCAKDFLDVWDVRVYSTNYLRTVMSVQSFLDGLLATNCYQPLADQHISLRGDGSRISNGSLEVPDHETVGLGGGDEALLKVQVRGRDQDTLNAFDRNPELMSKLVSEVISSPEFQYRDGAAAPLAARLANILPGLARKKKNTTGFNAAPSGINWIEATDHFVCRSAHGIKFARFTDFEHDDRFEHTLSALAHQTTTHLAWRFRQWYKHPKLLAAIAAPPLREIAEQLTAATTLDVRERHPFTVYSCHDVTILALLYGIGAEFLAGDERGGWRFWPSYASTLVFELVRIQDTGKEDTHVVRVLLNGKPVKSFNMGNVDDYWNGSSIPAGNGPHEMLLADDFAQIVAGLEQRGGINRQNFGADGTDAKRDMSNWTG